ncbi:hypothetical protein EN35_04305 [Rhodococcus qingshengii]|nr:hypothetical protein EN35_04305 [Rhodococcus qingshengii]
MLGDVSERATRGLVDIASLLLAAPWLLRSPRGDGHPVLVLPGLLTSDVSTLALRTYLSFLGYRVHGWNLGLNTGPTATVVDGLPAALAEVADRYEQKVSVIGWSLGGIYARKLARDLPDSVRQVVTLGSPFGLTSLEQTRVGSLYARLSGNHAILPPVDGIESEQGSPISVPATSVYSRHDGIVPWQACCETSAGLSESIAVQGSHMGLTHNPSALWTVADRLAQDVDNWQPFAAPKRLRRMFPC